MDRPYANRSLANRSLANRSLANRSLVDRSVIDRSYTSRSLDHSEMPDQSSENGHRFVNDIPIFSIKILEMLFLYWKFYFF